MIKSNVHARRVEECAEWLYGTVVFKMTSSIGHRRPFKDVPMFKVGYIPMLGTLNMLHVTTKYT